MTGRRCAFIIEIIADSIRIEHVGGNELPADVAKMVTESEFVAGIDPETVGERQRLTGFLDDCALVSARDQEWSDDEKEKCLESHERLDCFKFSDLSPRPNCSISGSPESISKLGHIP